MKTLIKTAFILALISTSCSIRKSFIAKSESANYTNWIGGQEGIGGTNFVFKVSSNTSEKVTLDSIHIDDVNIARWEQSQVERSIIIKTSINYNNNKPTSIDSTKTTSSKTDNKHSFNKAKLYFSSDKENITIVFDKMNKLDNKYYP